DHSPNPATYRPQQRQLDQHIYGMHPSRLASTFWLMKQPTSGPRMSPKKRERVYTANGLEAELGQ
ncbi:hypothetical protein FIBSPDRAFT_876198, partial [Athelia psychrophila]